MKIHTNSKRFVTMSWWGLSFFIIFFYQKSCALNDGITSNIVITCVDVLCLLCCSYIIKHHLLPKLLYKRKLFFFVLLILLLVITFANVILLLQWAWYTLSGLIEKEHSFELLTDFFYQLFDCYMVVFVGSLCIITFQLLLDQWLAQNRYNRLQKEKAQTELNFLKAQINPHFLFNSINSIFATIDKNNKEARDIVLKFSEMLRYQLYDCNVEIICLQKELSYLANYIDLQKLRKEENLFVSFESKGTMDGFKIAPLLLIPFIENAFKYASNYDHKENSVKVLLTRESDFFHFYCFNTKDLIPSRNLSKESGIGIKNVKRRLELLYPNKHDLEIIDGNFTFEVNLKIKIDS